MPGADTSGEYFYHSFWGITFYRAVCKRVLSDGTGRGGDILLGPLEGIIKVWERL